MLATAFLCLLAQADAVPPPPRWNVAVASALTRESWQFHFENPSSYDTVELVPHFFEQTYDLANVWLGAKITHPSWGSSGELTLAMTPQRTRRADDFDTFFQLDGNIVVTGTTGGASVRSWLIADRFSFARWGKVTIAFEYAYRRHRARYHDGDGVTTTTRPPSVVHRLVTTRETTVSEVHELTWAFQGGGRALGGRLDGGLEVTPVGVARLTVDLPDKYPGRLLKFQARVSILGGRVAYSWRYRGWGWRAGVRAASSASWRRAQALDARTLALEVDVIPR